MIQPLPDPVDVLLGLTLFSVLYSRVSPGAELPSSHIIAPGQYHVSTRYIALILSHQTPVFDTHLADRRNPNMEILNCDGATRVNFCSSPSRSSPAMTIYGNGLRLEWLETYVRHPPQAYIILRIIYI